MELGCCRTCYRRYSHIQQTDSVAVCSCVRAEDVETVFISGLMLWL